MWLWDLDEQRAPVKLQGATGLVRPVAMSGRWTVSGGHDRRLLVWDTGVLRN